MVVPWAATVQPHDEGPDRRVAEPRGVQVRAQELHRHRRLRHRGGMGRCQGVLGSRLDAERRHHHAVQGVLQHVAHRPGRTASAAELGG